MDSQKNRWAHVFSENKLQVLSPIVEGARKSDRTFKDSINVERERERIEKVGLCVVL